MSNHKTVVNIYIVCEVNKNSNIISYLTLEMCLFGAASFTKTADIDKNKYSAYGVGFDGKGTF